MSDQQPLISDELSYGEATQELESILEAIDGDEVGLDDLGAKVERAAALIDYCRERIDATELQVKEVIQGLEEEE